MLCRQRAIGNAFVPEKILHRQVIRGIMIACCRITAIASATRGAYVCLAFFCAVLLCALDYGLAIPLKFTEKSERRK
ncbi:MAG: hypothetical protein E7446_00965 [Ruminococcaceae bacterium]|nr:hypothetical protein [Oscillospiraceae bacterium]